MKLRQNVVMVLILAGLLGSICIGITIGNHSEPKEVIVPEDEIVEDVIPTTFNKGIKNSDKVPSEVMNVITSYMDDYFLSLYTLELQDTTKYFSNEKEAKVSDYSIKFTIESRKLYDFDFTMSDAGYTLNITDYYESDGKYYVDFLEDDYMSFKFLNGISSEAYDIENYMVIEQVNGEYKINSYDKVQGYYMMFRNDIDENLDEVYKMYFDELQYTITRENKYKMDANATPYVANEIYVTAYNRDAAVKYADQYCHARNDEWYDFLEEGNCQNFASQVLLAGGMKMDYDGYEEENEIWYYNDGGDYTSTWAGVPYFHKYCKSDNPTLVCDVDINTYYAEPGDIIQVGLSTVTHTTIVSKIVDGHILLHSNSIDMKDFPLEAYTYPVRKLIKILGSN